MKQLTGAEIVIECLKEQGVDTVFGYPGGTILNVYDELYKHSKEINHVLTSHEQGAAHAADGYARATGKVGVCMATSGPGATNLVTGIATAYMDSVPVVAITANVGVAMLGKDSFQEVDIAGVVMPITKHSFIVKDIKDLATTIRKAFKIAKSGRPGPVLVDITKDVTANKTGYEPSTPEPITRSTDKIKGKDIDKAVELIGKAKKPFVMVGGGCVTSGAQSELMEFVEKIDAPVCDTLMGKGAFDNNHKLYSGMVGMHGTKASDLGLTEADLLIAIGARFSDRVTGNAAKFCKHAKIIHIDVDAAEINKNVKVHTAIVGDAKSVLEQINSKLNKNYKHADWIKHINDLKKKYPLTIYEKDLCGPSIIKSIYEQTKGDAVICTDVGQHQMWAAQFYNYSKPRTLITSGGLGTMGFGLGAAIGAKYGRPDKTVINIAGDGCFRMNVQELMTASRYNVPIIEIVINNHVLGMVRQWQTLFYGERYSATILDDSADFKKIAEGMGATAFTVTTQEEFDKAFAKALKAKGPVVIDAQICKDDKVFPMVPAGAPLEEVFDHDDVKNK